MAVNYGTGGLTMDNEQCAIYGAAAVDAGQADHGNPLDVQAADAIANILHWAARNRINIESLVNSARRNLEYELDREARVDIADGVRAVVLSSEDCAAILNGDRGILS